MVDLTNPDNHIIDIVCKNSLNIGLQKNGKIICWGKNTDKIDIDPEKIYHSIALGSFFGGIVL